MSSEPSTARPLPCLITIQGKDYQWTEEGGLDPSAVLTLDRFIRREAWRYAAIGARTGLSLEDLMQEGHSGALMAAQRFNPAKGVRYISYAVWWIRARIMEALRRHQVYIPHGLQDRLRRSVGLPPVCSLDLAILEDGTSLADCLLGEHGAEATEAVLAASEVRVLIGQLKPRERHILIRHFGLQGHAPETLGDIGISLGLSRERIRQLENQALARIRKTIAVKG